MSIPDIDHAEQFIAAHGRVLDRRRFERLLRDGEAQPVRDAVAAYRNPDGGFGHALEPDGRSPASQPPAVELALRTLHESDAWSDELAASACDWLTATGPAEGGTAFVHPGIEGWPHAPWWVPTPGGAASITITGLIAGTLHARGFRHPWLDRATGVMWSRIDRLTEAGPYDMHGVLRFLAYVPDRDRAEQALQAVGQLLFKLDLVALDPDAPGETHGPLDYAPVPGCLARQLFEDSVIDAHLDHLARDQRDDGGWMFNWMSWSPAAEQDWRGCVTVNALATLRAYGRL
ncbi:MAG TPA: hypothetical protein VGI31_09175 [Streptosporangiaceae bacterium]|jgi:hypothetical protein